MTKYLSMNGTSDYITTPSMTFTRIVIDAALAQNNSSVQYVYHVPDGQAYFYSGGSPDYFVGVLTINGNAQSTSSDFITASRSIYDNSIGLTLTEKIYFFERSTGIQRMAGKLYDVKIYNGATLVAHYDTSTGTVKDQSGNGRDATLVGGTWLDDGAGAGTAYTASLSDSVGTGETLTKKYAGFKTLTDAISTADTISKRLSAFVIDSISTGDTSDKSDTKQIFDAVSSDDSFSFTQGKAINLSDSVAIADAISKAMGKLQTDYVASGDTDKTAVTRKLLDAITQSDVITVNKGKAVLLSDTLNISDSLSKALRLHQSESVNLTDDYTKQSTVSIRLYDVVVSTDDLSKKLPNAPELIGHIKLDGQRVLNVYLTGQRNLNVNIKGVI